MEARWLWAQDALQRSLFTLEAVPGSLNPSDIGTKALDLETIEKSFLEMVARRRVWLGGGVVEDFPSRSACEDDHRADNVVLAGGTGVGRLVSAPEAWGQKNPQGCGAATRRPVHGMSVCRPVGLPAQRLQTLESGV